MSLYGQVIPDGEPQPIGSSEETPNSQATLPPTARPMPVVPPRINNLSPSPLKRSNSGQFPPPSPPKRPSSGALKGPLPPLPSTPSNAPAPSSYGSNSAPKHPPSPVKRNSVNFGRPLPTPTTSEGHSVTSTSPPSLPLPSVPPTSQLPSPPQPLSSQLPSLPETPAPQQAPFFQPDAFNLDNSNNNFNNNSNNIQNQKQQFGANPLSGTSPKNNSQLAQGLPALPKLPSSIPTTVPPKQPLPVVTSSVPSNLSTSPGSLPLPNTQSPVAPRKFPVPPPRSDPSTFQPLSFQPSSSPPLSSNPRTSGGFPKAAPPPNPPAKLSTPPSSMKLPPMPSPSVVAPTISTPTETQSSEEVPQTTSIAQPSPRAELLPVGGTSPSHNPTSPRFESFQTGVLQPGLVKRPQPLFGSRSAAIQRPDETATSSPASPSSDADRFGQQDTESKDSTQQSIVFPTASIVPPALVMPASAAKPSAPDFSDLFDSFADKSTLSQPSSLVETGLSTMATSEEHLDTSADNDDPPPPPDGFDYPFEEVGNEESLDPSSPQYTNIMNNEESEENTANIIAIASNYSALGREDLNGPPPPGLSPLPANFHPKTAPPPLPAGIVHPDHIIAAPVAIEVQAEEKKKKKGGFGLFGASKDKKKDEEDITEKSGGIMSGLKKMGKKFGQIGKSKDDLNTGMGMAAQPSQVAPIVGDASPIRDKLDGYSRLMELLCRPDLYLLNITASIVKRGDVDKQSRAWVHLLTPRGIMVDLLGKVISTEVEKTDHEGTLFRNNTFSVGLMSAFAQEVGRAYLKATLGPLLHQILNSGLSYEINPERTDGGPVDEDTIDTNTINLIEACGAYVDSIVKSLPEVPVELRQVCSHLRNAVSSKFPASVNTCVGGFFFLRFITPAVVSPEGFGVQNPDEPISIESRRPLILISKTLQQISNEMYFSEDHMMSINSFITDNIGTFQKFFQDICNFNLASMEDTPATPYTHEANRTRDDSLIRIHQFLSKSLPEIKAVAQVEPLPQGINYDPISELEKILNELGEAPDPKVLKAPAAALPVPQPDSAKLKKKK